MKKKRWVLWVLVTLLLAFLAWKLREAHFEWQVFKSQISHADFRKIGLGIGCIYVGYVLRAWRWSIFLKPTKEVSLWSVLGPQVIGFTAVALLGRLADLVRPYLVARRVALPVSSQVAVYTVERMFDLGAVGMVFSSVLFFTPGHASLPHYEMFKKAAAVGLLGTLALALFTIAVRFAGSAVASLAEKMLNPLSPKLGTHAEEKIRTFRDGLNVFRSGGDAVAVVAISLVMWGLIAAAYWLTMRAFVESPQLATVTLSQCMLLMAASIGGSLIQLPIVGWFTQIAVTAATMQALFGAAWEPALGCGGMLLMVTFLCIIPVGLVWAQIEHVSLRRVAEVSGEAAQAQDA